MDSDREGRKPPHGELLKAGAQESQAPLRHMSCHEMPLGHLRTALLER